MEAKGFHTRGYLPHIESFAAPTFITFRLADSLPQAVLERIKAEVAHLNEKERKSALWRGIESHLDSGAGSCLLKRSENAQIVQDALKYAEKQGRLALIAWVVMPNHVHFLADFQQDVSKTMQSLKRHTSRQIGPPGQLWQADYFDRIIRSEDHLRRTVEYIEWNPVKAELCVDPTHFPFSSARENALGLR